MLQGKSCSLISADYQQQLQAIHADPTIAFGGGGHKHVGEIYRLIRKYQARSLLDYGCGAGTLRKALGERALKVFEYDLGVPGKETPPSHPCDIVVCTDVLEHIEPDCLDAVVDHIYSLMRRACFMVIATRPANLILPDGRNAHLIIQAADYWLSYLARTPWHIEVRRRPADELVLVLSHRRK